MPGVSTRAAIQSNHSRMVEAAACAGELGGNPVREDIEEAAALCGVDFILNVVLDEHKHIIRAVSGDVTKAHRAGCAFLIPSFLKRSLNVRISCWCPKAARQGHQPVPDAKGADNAKHAVKHGGIVILVGSCREGLGERVFEEWMTTSPSAPAMIERIGRDFQLGGHKAAAIAMVLQDAAVYLVSELDPAFVSRIFLTPFSSAQAALDAALQKLGKGATVLAMPYGGSTLPRPEK